MTQHSEPTTHHYPRPSRSYTRPSIPVDAFGAVFPELPSTGHVARHALHTMGTMSEAGTVSLLPLRSAVVVRFGRVTMPGVVMR